MSSPRIFTPGGYSYLPSVFQYSAGVMAEPGYCLEQIRFKKPLPLQDGFKAVENRLRFLNRPVDAFADCGPRSLRLFDDEGLIDFNKTYVKQLQSWNIYTPAVDGVDAINPVARTNVCPEHHGPQEVSMYAFTYSVPSTAKHRSFVISGGGDARKGSEPYKDRIIAFGDTSQAGLRKKMAFVIEEMTDRLRNFGLKWSDVTKAQAYSVHDIAMLVDELLSKPGLIQHGLVWHFARPPVSGLDYEMDLRGSVNELFSTD